MKTISMLTKTRKRSRGIPFLAAALMLLQIFFSFNVTAQSDGLPRGAHLMPYTRYEANATAVGGGATMLAPTFDQKQTQSEASDQTCASLNAQNSYVRWNLSSPGQGMVLRFSIPDNAAGTGQTGTLALFVGGTFVQNISLSSKWAWQYFSPNPTDGTKDPHNQPQAGWTMRMRFDEVRVKLPSSVAAGTEVRLVKQANDGINYLVDFIEMEPIPAQIAQPTNYVNVTSHGAIPNDANDDRQAFINAIGEARSQGKSIYVPAGRFILSSKLDMINMSNFTLQGAGMWHTELYFTSTSPGGGGIATGGSGSNIHMKDFYMNTDNTTRTSDYKGFVGGHGTNSTMQRVWVEHFEVGFWSANFFGTPVTDGMLVTNCRFRNNYADGINFSRGTSNSICEHSNMRNNGDDAMASWSSHDGPQQCINNEFRYCTAENTWRAGGIGFFGGGGHKGHHLIIKDGVENGIRVNSDFPTVGSSFSNTLWMEIYETTVISCGTNANLWYNRYGAVDIFTRLYDVQNLRLRNVNIENSQKDAVMIYNVGTQFRITNLEFINVTINGAGKDGNVNNYTQGTWDDYAGYGLYILPGNPGTNGSMSVTNLVLNDIPSTPAINNESPTTFTINTVGTVRVTGVSISPTTAVSIPQGGTFQLTKVISPSNATNQNVTWTSGSPGVATVNASGLVTAVSPGTAVITVRTEDGGFTSTKTVTVTAAVNIAATDASAGEGGNAGVFTISTTSTSSNITVGYTVSGTATSADYSASPALSGSVTLTSTAPSATITINPIDDSSFEGSESLTLTLQPGAGYNLGGSTTASVAIADNDNPPCTAPVIAQASTAPVIDQNIDAVWNNAPVGSINNVTLGARPADFTGSQWRAMYDATNLYILVEVKDANRFNDSGTSWWEDDVVEIFIDGNNSKGTSYDGVDDFQFGFRYNDTALKLGQSSAQRSTGIVFAQHNVTNGYNIEVRIPWATIGVTPGIGNRIGFDVSVDDDDNGGVRDAQMTAFATTGIGWSNPSVFGSVVLTTCGGGLQPPVVTNTSLPSGTVNATYSTNITATNSPTSYSATGLPAGLSVNTSTGVISGTPTATGTFTVSLTATNSAGTSPVKQLSLVINAAPSVPVINNTSLPSATVNASYSVTVTATNSPTSFSASGLPAGLSINTTSGVISGTPTASGTFTVSLSASNGAGTGPVKQLSLVVNAAPSVPVINNTSLPSGTVNTSYSVTITATNSPTSFSASGLPAGLSINTTSGVISGTPTASGTFAVNLSASNGAGAGPVKQLSLVISAGGVPVINNTSLAAGSVGVSYSVTISATNSPTSYGASGLPSGLSVNTTTGVISGTPTETGTFSIGLSATNASGTGNKTLTLSVSEPAGTSSAYRASAAITVNGTLSESGWNLDKTVAKNTVGTGNNTVKFAVMWDNTNMYVGVRVLDANLFSDSPNTWEDDAVEIYIDANNNKLTTYDGRDNQIIKNWNKSTVFTKLAITGLQHAWAAVTGGYSVEIAIPWTQLGFASAPVAGTKIGFDVGYDDDDNGGARDAQAVWNGTINNYQNTSAFGTVVLSNATRSGTSRISMHGSEETSFEDADQSVSYWPNEVIDVLHVSTDGTFERVEIVDLIGRHHVSESIFGKKEVTLDVSTLTGGLHIVKMRGKDKNKAFRIIKK